MFLILTYLFKKIYVKVKMTIICISLLHRLIAKFSYLLNKIRKKIIALFFEIGHIHSFGKIMQSHCRQYHLHGFLWGKSEMSLICYRKKITCARKFGFNVLRTSKQRLYLF